MLRIWGRSGAIRGRRNRRIITAGDQEELKGKIRGLWNNREKLDAYTKKCREKRFQEAPEYAEQLVKEFRRLLESHEHKETTAKDHDPE